MNFQINELMSQCLTMINLFCTENWPNPTSNFNLQILCPSLSNFQWSVCIFCSFHQNWLKLAWAFPLTLIRRGWGGGGGHDAPLDILCDNYATRKALATTLYDNFLSSFPHILTPNLWHPGVRFRSYVTFVHARPTEKGSKGDFVCKINANWVFSLSSYKYAYFYSQWLKLICFSIIVLQKVSATNFAGKNNKNKRSKKQKYIINL